MTLISTVVQVKTADDHLHVIEFTGPRNEAARLCRAVAEKMGESLGSPVRLVAVDVDTPRGVMGRVWNATSGEWTDDDPEDYPIYDPRRVDHG